MDILAHGLWAAVGIAALKPHLRFTPGNGAATVAFAFAPDVVQWLPLLAWVVFGSGPLATLPGFALALPGQEPAMPAAVVLLTHHLHCTMHSAVVLGAVTLLVGWLRRGFWLPLLGWWLHIVIDVFTHSADYYPAPVLYPFTQRGFDGLAWNTPWALALNYLALMGAALWLGWKRRRA